MGDLRDAYNEVQASKSNTVAAAPEVEAQVREALKAETGHAATATTTHVLAGMEWVFRLVVEHELDVDELMEITDDVTDNSVPNILRMVRLGQLDTEQAIQAAIGAAMFTALWTGLKLGQQKGWQPPSGEGDDPQRIAHLYAYLVTDPQDNREGIPAVARAGGIPQPLIGADRDRVMQHRETVQNLARKSGQTATLARFAEREDLEEFRP